MAKRRRSKNYKPSVAARKKKRALPLHQRIFYVALAVVVIGGLFYGMALLTERSQPPVSGAAITNPSLLSENRSFDIVYGRADAPVTMVEYASLTCGHCKYFHEDVVAPIKARFIDTGKLRFIYRHYPLNKPALQAALLLSCLDSDAERYALMKTLFSTQEQWGHSSAHKNQPGALRRLFSSLSDTEYEACLADKAREKALLSEQMQAQKELGINSTPTIFINEKLYKGRRTAAALFELIEKYLSH